MKVNNMFESHLRALTVAGVMTLLAFPAVADTHRWGAYLEINIINRSAVPVVEVCVDSRSRYGGGHEFEECFRDLDWAAGTSENFWFHCNGAFLVEHYIYFTVQNGDIYGDDFSTTYCDGFNRDFVFFE